MLTDKKQIKKYFYSNIPVYLAAMEKIVQINLTELDAEITNLISKRDSIDIEISFKSQLKEYALSKIGNIVKAKVSLDDTISAGPFIEKGPAPSISNYILSELNKSEKKAKELITDYEIMYGGQNLVGRFYNTLSRLKDAKKIKSIELLGEKGGKYAVI